jgi:hypothetical protein
VTTYEEWRVTGTWHDQPYERVFSPNPQPWQRWARGIPDPEGAARDHVARAAQWSGGWTDGPHLHRRTVTVTDWTEVDA